MSAPCPTSPPPSGALPTLGVEFPADHPVARRQSKLAREKAEAALPVTPQKGAELQQASLLEQFSAPLTIPSSPAEQARRMSINPQSRRNSILAIPPIHEDIPAPIDHLPAPGEDGEVDISEIEKEIDEIDTVG